LTNLNISMYYDFMTVTRSKTVADIDSGELETAALVFKALSDPARLKILSFLANREDGQCCGTEEGICACDLEDVIELSQPTVSHHMKLLISANLVLGEKRGKWMFYRIDPKGFLFIKPLLETFGK
jgi:ArsR family transcriptional regulator, arsenate/arsenite/antimonite-responsive transcriptional repressor